MHKTSFLPMADFGIEEELLFETWEELKNSVAAHPLVGYFPPGDLLSLRVKDSLCLLSTNIPTFGNYLRKEESAMSQLEPDELMRLTSFERLTLQQDPVHSHSLP